MINEAAPLILTIEDEPSVRDNFRFYLEDCGYRVNGAEDGEQGLASFEQQRPDLILLDLRMPKLDGFGLLEALQGKIDDIPVIVISGIGDIGDALEALRQGAWDYMLKPIEDLSILRHNVERGLEWGRISRENRNHQQHLEQEVARQTQELRRLSAHIEEVREEEKRFIATEIHDELGVTLTAINMDLSWLEQRLPSAGAEIGEKLTEMRRLVTEAVATSRRIISDLRPSILDTLGLIAALEWQATQFSRRYNLVCQIQSDGDDSSLSDRYRITLFRIFQEALTNVAKYAQAQRVTATLLIQPEQIRLEIHDDGCGFDTTQIGHHSHGIQGMKERAGYLDGVVEVSSEPGQGTTISVELPKSGMEIAS